jgi:ribosome-associated protein
MALKKKSSFKAKGGAKKAPAARKKTTAKKPGARKKTGPSKAARKKALVQQVEEVPAGPPENPRAKALAQKIGQLLLDKKASQILVLDVRGMASYADYIVLASGDSDRQVSAMAEHVQVKVKEEDGLHPTGTEGKETGQWVLIDYGEVVVHLFLKEVRSFYDLEGLWADAPWEELA